MSKEVFETEGGVVRTGVIAKAQRVEPNPKILEILLIMVQTAASFGGDACLSNMDC